MSDELIYKVAEEIYLKQEEIKEQIVDLKDQIQISADLNEKRANSILAFLKQNSTEMARITKFYSKEGAVRELFKFDTCDYREEKLATLNRVGFDKFRTNYLDQKKREQLDRLLNVFG